MCIRDRDTSVYFRDKKIWACGQKYRDYQGKYPVIFLTFKAVSYTHLDVYKRQTLGCAEKITGIDAKVAGGKAHISIPKDTGAQVTYSAVSYTHLDVYKRQGCMLSAVCCIWGAK